MSTLQVRERLDADLPAIHRIVVHEVGHGTAHWSLTPPSETELLTHARTVAEAGQPYLVAELDGAVLGFAYAAQYRPREGFRYTVENSVYVAPDARRQGVARALLTHLIDACSARGARQMIAGIGSEDPAASIALHAALGFREVGRMPRVGFKFERWLDLVWMQRELGPASVQRRVLAESSQ